MHTALNMYAHILIHVQSVGVCRGSAAVDVAAPGEVLLDDAQHTAAGRV